MEMAGVRMPSSGPEMKVAGGREACPGPEMEVAGVKKARSGPKLEMEAGVWEASSRGPRCLPAVWAGLGLVGTMTGLVSPALCLEVGQRGGSASVLGLLYGVFPLVQAAASPFSASLVATFGVTTVSQCGLITSGVFTAAFCLLDRVVDYDVFVSLCLLLRCLQALGSSAVVTALLSKVTTPAQGTASDTCRILTVVTGTATALGPALGAVLSVIGGFGMSFYVVGLLLCLCTALVHGLENEVDLGGKCDRTTLLQKLTACSGSVDGWLGYLSLLCSAATWTSVQAHWPVYAWSALEVTAGQSALLWTLGGGCFSLACVLFSRPSASRLQVTAVCLLAASLALAMFHHCTLPESGHAFWTVCLAGCLLQLCLATVFTCTLPPMSYTSEPCPQRLLFVIRLWYTGQWVASFLAALAAGIVTDITAFPAMLEGLTAISLTMGLILTLRIVSIFSRCRTDRKTESTPLLDQCTRAKASAATHVLTLPGQWTSNE